MASSVSSSFRLACKAWCCLVVVSGCSSPERFQTSTATGTGGETSSSATGSGGGGSGGGGGSPVAPCPSAWVHSFGGEGPQTVESVAVDMACNVVATGTFTTGIDLGAGPIASVVPGLFAAKLGPDGALSWARTFAPAADEPQTGWMGWDTQKPHRTVATGPSGAVAFAARFGDGVDFGAGTMPAGHYVVALAADGSLLWAKSFADAAGTATIDTLAMGPGGEVYAAGTFTGAIDLGKFSLSSDDGLTDGFLVRLDPAGQPAESVRFDYVHGAPNAASVARFRDITILPGGDLLLSGGFWNQVDFGGGLLQSLCGYSYISCQYYVANLFYVGVSAAGGVTFSNSQSDWEWVIPKETAFTPKSELLKARMSNEGTEVLRLLRYDPTGALSSGITAVYAAPDSTLLLRAVGSDAASDFVVAAYADQPFNLLGDSLPAGEFVAWIDESGQLVRHGSIAGQMKNAVLATHPGGSAVLAGAFEGTLATAGATVSSGNGEDAAIFVIP